MKAKLYLGLAAGLVLFLLGGLVMTQMVEAQIQKKTPVSHATNFILWDYDSGWQDLATSEELTLNHNLGGDQGEYFVYLAGRFASGWSIHQSSYGTDSNSSYSHGAEWYACTASSITIWRAAQDDNVDQEFRWQQVRVRMLRNQ